MKKFLGMLCFLFLAFIGYGLTAPPGHSKEKIEKIEIVTEANDCQTITAGIADNLTIPQDIRAYKQDVSQISQTTELHWPNKYTTANIDIILEDNTIQYISGDKADNYKYIEQSEPIQKIFKPHVAKWVILDSKRL